MARRAGPSFRSRQLAMELRKLRTAGGLTKAQIAESVGMSASKISRVEKTETGIYPDDLNKLLDLYRVTDQRRVELLDVARRSQERGALYVYGGRKFPEDWQTWIDFESEASSIYSYEPLVIPGLLQTPEYAGAIIQATGLGLSAAEIRSLVDSRMTRQEELLGKDDGVRLHVIIEERAITCQFDDAKPFVRQLRRLLDLASQPNIAIQAMPSNAGLHPGLNGPFIVLNYDHEPSLVWLENKISSLILDEEEQIEVYTQTWDELCALAYNVEKSVDFISVIIAQVDGKS